MNKAQKQQIARTFLITLGFNLLIRGAVDLWVDWQLRKEDREDEAEYQRLKTVSEDEWLEDDDDQLDEDDLTCKAGPMFPLYGLEESMANHPAGKGRFDRAILGEPFSGSDIEELIAANDSMDDDALSEWISNKAKGSQRRLAHQRKPSTDS